MEPAIESLDPQKPDTTDRALRDSEHQLQAVYESALDAFLIADDEGRYLSANPAACDLLGLPEAEIRGRRISDFMAPGPSFEEAWSDFLARGRQRGELALVLLDGTRRHVEFNAVSNVLPGRHLSILRDITERREAEEALRRNEAEHKRAEDALRLLAEAGHLLSESLDYHATLANVARLAVPTLADWCVLDLVSEEGDLERLATVHADPDLQPLVDELKRHPPQWDDEFGTARILRTGQPLLIPNVDLGLVEKLISDPDHRRILHALDTRSLVTVPFVARGRLLGAWAFVRSTPGRRPYDDGDLQLAATLARRAGLAIDNARLYRGAEAANRPRTSSSRC